jgi:hypothetical protein
MKKLQTYDFTLVLDGVDDKTEGLEDKLFEAGCDDALINFRNGTVYLDFNRQASSVEDAIISAIKNIEDSELNAKVISILPDDLVGIAEIANRLNKSRQTVSLWVNRARRQEQPFPHPVSKLSDKSPMWRWYDVVNWLFQQKLINDSKLVDSAKFIENINAVLNERDPEIKKYRHYILNKLKLDNKRNLMSDRNN